MQEILLIVFIGIVAVALLLQSLAFLGMYWSIRRLSERVDGISTSILKEVNAVSGRVNDLLIIVKSIGEGFNTLQQNVNDTASIIHKRVQALDAFMEETAGSARLQILRIQDVVDTASRRVEESFEVLQSSVLAPAREVNAIIRGIRVGMDVLLKRRHSPSGAVHQDEEMFI